MLRPRFCPSVRRLLQPGGPEPLGAEGAMVNIVSDSVHGVLVELWKREKFRDMRSWGSCRSSWSRGATQHKPPPSDAGIVADLVGQKMIIDSCRNRLK